MIARPPPSYEWTLHPGLTDYGAIYTLFGHTYAVFAVRPMMAQFSTASKVRTENRVDGGAKRRTVRRLLVHTAAIDANIYRRSKEIREHES